MQQITANDLKQKIEKNENIFILDVRPEFIFKGWKIKPYQNVQLVNIPIHELYSQLDKLPKDQTIYSICSRGNSSKMASSQLVGLGYSVENIEGGMKSWSCQFDVRTLSKGIASIYQFERLGKGCLSYLIISGSDAVVIDPSMYIDQYIDKASEAGATISKVIDTHLHADHISGGLELSKKTNAEYLCSKKDFKDALFPFIELTSDLEIKFENSLLKALHTPGHTFGMTSLLLNNNYLFTGDALFVKGVGRPDLGGHAEELAPIQFTSINHLFKLLGKGTMILPTHFSSEDERSSDGFIYATMKEVEQKNELLSKNEMKVFVDKILTNLPPQPANYASIRQVNLAAEKPSQEESEELEFGPNNCAAI